MISHIDVLFSRQVEGVVINTKEIHLKAFLNSQGFEQCVFSQSIDIKCTASSAGPGQIFKFKGALE